MAISNFRNNYELFSDELTPIEVSTILNISRPTLYVMIRRGDLVSYQIGSKYFIPKSTVLDYLSAHQNGSEV